MADTTALFHLRMVFGFQFSVSGKRIRGKVIRRGGRGPAPLGWMAILNRDTNAKGKYSNLYL
jgi:hypothetical protein